MGDKKEDLIKIVGAENILDDNATLNAFSQDKSFVLPMKPWLVVTPKNKDEVQEIVRWANQTRTPLVPVSSGPPHFNGDTVPSVLGAVIVDLSSLNRIIRIDRRNRMIIIEPGVTFGQLQSELSKNDLRMSTPLLPRPNKSVVASLLERQPTLVTKYQWVLLDPLKCLEIIWGTGDKLWTGDAGECGQSLEEQWERGLAQAIPMGPAQVDYYRLVSAAQGSMGIVTWASIKCEILPSLHNLFFIPAERLDDLIDCVYRITRIRFGDEILILNSADLASILGQSADQITMVREALPPWVAIVGIAGRDVLPEERVKFQKEDISSITRQSGLEFTSAVSGASDEQVMQAISNPSKEPYWKLRSKGGCQDIFFLTTLDKTPGFVQTMYSVAETLGYPSSDIGIYLQPLHQGVSCHCEFSLPYDPDDQKEVAKIREILTKASEALIIQGAFFSRPYGIWADMVYSKDAGTAALLRKVKNLFDPNNVMNTGKLCFRA